MKTALVLFAIQGALGAFDTLYYHELRGQLVARVPATRVELALHAARDFVYAFLFCALPSLAFRGAWAALVLGLLAFEIGITLADFAIEPRARAPEDVLPGERVTHGVMAIVYGAALAGIVPELVRGLGGATAIARAEWGIPEPLRLLLFAMGVGVALSGLRDAYAALGLPGGGYPWAGARARLSRTSGSQR